MKPIVVMGVSGSGKSAVGALLAERLAVPFCEGDDLHTAASIAKMQAGRALNDYDRGPWLDRVAAWIASHPNGGVITCSALKRGYRDRLRRGQVAAPLFVWLDPPRSVLDRRLAKRTDHFMPASLLDTQLRTLERPTRDEQVLHLSREEPLEQQVDTVVTHASISSTSSV